ncbi:MAG: mechanosensitive ion channel family protein [bacterium]|nr:MAG: mechanosensitive ion channel family protein [bacterium]
MFDNFFSRQFYGNTISQWLVALLVIVASVVIGRALYWIVKNFFRRITSRSKTKLDNIIIDMIEEPLIFAIVLAGIWFGLKILTFNDTVTLWISRAYYILIIFNIAWLITRLLDSLIKEYLVPITEESKSDLDDQLLPIARKGVKAIIWIVAVIVALNNAGYDVGAVLAGLGIGGLAFALAAQDTVSNLFGGFTILTDKPFKINERVKIAGYDGTLKEIGIRTSRLVTLEGRTVTIPNSTFTKNPIENVSSEPSRKVVLNLGLTYDMTDKQMGLAMNLLKEIAANNENVEEKVLTSFNGFGDFSLNILFIYYIKKDSDIFDTQTQMNLEILKKFNENNLEFAFPSQTIYAKQV